MASEIWDFNSFFFIKSHWSEGWLWTLP